MVKQNKVSPLHAMKVYGGMEIQLHLFFPFALMEVCHQLCAVAALHQGKSPWYPLNGRLIGPQCFSGHFGVEKCQLPCWESYCDSLFIQPIT